MKFTRKIWFGFLLSIFMLVMLVLSGVYHGVHFVSADKVEFESYVPSTQEKYWIDNVSKLQDRVCDHVSKEIMDGWISEVKRLNSMNDNEMIEYMKDIESRNKSQIISHFHYKVHSHDKPVYTIAVPIEPYIGLLRDPRKCLDPKSETYTESKEYLLPLPTAAFHLLNPVQHHHKWGANEERPPQTFVFDAGATFYNDSVGSASMKFLVEWYTSHNLTVNALTGWEAKKQPPENIRTGVPQWLLPHYTYINLPIVHPSRKDALLNPIQHIESKVRRSDNVVFKLDIDNISLEQAFIAHIKESASFRALIDDFYYEEHFRNRAMSIHGWMGYKSSLADYYHKTGVPLRTMGFRIHYWP